MGTVSAILVCWRSIYYANCVQNRSMPSDQKAIRHSAALYSFGLAYNPIGGLTVVISIAMKLWSSGNKYWPLPVMVVIRAGSMTIFFGRCLVSVIFFVFHRRCQFRFRFFQLSHIDVTFDFFIASTLTFSKCKSIRYCSTNLLLCTLWASCPLLYTTNDVITLSFVRIFETLEHLASQFFRP